MPFAERASGPCVDTMKLFVPTIEITFDAAMRLFAAKRECTSLADEEIAAPAETRLVASAFMIVPPVIIIELPPERESISAPDATVVGDSA